MKYCLTLLLLTILLQPASLKKRISDLENSKGQTETELSYLGILYMYGAQYEKAGEVFARLHKATDSINYLFYRALNYSLYDQATANHYWDVYLSQDERKREGPRWDEFSRFIKDINFDQDVKDKEKLMETVRYLYLGRSFHTAMAVIDIYHSYEELDPRLLELKAEMYYRTNLLDMAEAHYRALYETAASPEHLLYLGRIRFKLEDYKGASDYLKLITDAEILKKGHYHYMMGAASYHQGDLAGYQASLAKFSELEDSEENSKLRKKLKRLKQ